MIITNDLIKEATLQVQSNIGNRVALDANNPSSNVGLTQFWYDLTDNNNKTTLNDVLLGTQSGVRAFTFTPRIDPVTNFGTTCSYGTIPDSTSIDISGWEITTEIWIKVTSLYGANQDNDPANWPLGINMNSQGLFGRWKADELYRGGNYGIEINDAQVIFMNNSSELAYHIATYNTIDNITGNWVQIVYKQDANNWSIIINGDNQIGYGTDPLILIANNQPLLVGKRGDTTRTEYTPSAFYGDISVFNVWDRKLSDAEVKNNYNFYSQRYL